MMKNIGQIHRKNADAPSAVNSKLAIGATTKDWNSIIVAITLEKILIDMIYSIVLSSSFISNLSSFYLSIYRAKSEENQVNKGTRTSCWFHLKMNKKIRIVRLM